MSPISIMYAIIVFYGRLIFQHRSYEKRLEQVAEKDDKNIGNNDENQGNKSNGIYKMIDMYGDWAHRVGRISQDVPFNRFIISTFCYGLLNRAGTTVA